jgi:hypothetical protein
MDWIEMLKNFGWLFFCIGMVQQQKELTYREKFNIAVFFCVVFQRAIVIITRKSWGLQALGKECAFAFFLILAWAAFSQDVFMYVWLLIWCVCMAKRRMEATRAFKNGEQLHSWSDGIPINLGKDIRMAKLWYEPICTVILGGIACWYYQQNGWPLRGLPCFLFWGAICMRVVQSLSIKADERREMTINDAKLEGEYEASRNRW